MPGKYKTIVATGLLGNQSSWDLGYAVADFGSAVVAATTGVATALALSIPDTFTLQPFIGGDSFPTVLAAATATRAAGAGSAPLAVVTRGWLYSATAAGTGVANIAATFTIVVNVNSVSSTSATGIQNTLVASTAVNGLTNPLTLLTFAAPNAERVASLTGTAPAGNPWLLFPGDQITVAASNTAGAAVTIGPNKLAVILEYS